MMSFSALFAAAWASFCAASLRSFFFLPLFYDASVFDMITHSLSWMSPTYQQKLRYDTDSSSSFSNRLD